MKKSSAIPRTKSGTTKSGSQDALAVAVKLHQEGDLEQAASAYRRILKSQPNEPNALHLLGVTFQQSKRPTEAVKWIKKALVIAPKNAAFHSNLASAYLSLGRLQEAEAHYREALRLAPNFADACNGLGAVLKGLGKLDEAIAQYQKTLTLKPGFVEAKSNLAHALVEQGRADEAEQVAREALRDNPNCVSAHINLGHALTVLGQVDAAAQSFRKALRLDPQSAAAYENLADLAAQGEYRLDDATLEKMQRLVTDERLPPGDASRLNLALAKVLDREGEYDKAFYHCRKGNEICRKLMEQTGRGFVPDIHRRQIARIMSVFSREFVDGFGASGIDSELPVFVVGMPRSGTSLVEQILASHPQVFGAGELRDIGTLVDRLSQEKKRFPEVMQGLSAGVLKETADHYLKRLRELGGDALRVIDKMPHNDLFLGIICLMFPGTRVIYCRRDPLDTCLSCYFQDFAHIQFACSLEHLAIFSLEQERLMAHWDKVLPLRIHTVWYEELVADPETESRKLVDFCDLTWAPDCLAFYRNRRAVKTASKLQVRRPVYGTSVQRWKRYRRHLGPLLDALSARQDA